MIKFTYSLTFLHTNLLTSSTFQACANPGEDSDQPMHRLSPIRFFTVWMKKTYRFLVTQCAHSEN